MVEHKIKDSKRVFYRLLHKLQSYPSIHLDTHSCNLIELTELLKIFIQQHALDGEHYQEVSDNFQNFSGQITMQDFSLIIEMDYCDFA